MIQVVGRGLRTVDPERLPGVVKTDCIVLDFAGAALRHGSLEQDDRSTAGSRRRAGAGRTCPEMRGGDPARLHRLPDSAATSGPRAARSAIDEST